jgi:anti-sigma B factor antagonist
MQIPVDKIGDVTVAMIAVDELDANNAAELKREMVPILDANTKMVVDLSRMRFIDSSGIGAMLSCLRQLRSKGGELKLCGMSKQVRAAFELLRMHRILDIVGTRDEAVQAFRT